jgi:UDP-glucose 4-epimerase
MRYLVTGGSGYIGSRLVSHLSSREATERIAIADVRPPRHYQPKTSFHQLDVRDRGGTRALLEQVRPDALVHLAYILDPIHDEALMYDVDVNGTQNVLDAASAAGVGQVLVTSSATAYGAFPDNPQPLEEHHPVRGQPNFSYARDKTESDRLCQLWAHQHPDAVMTIVRPCQVFGPTVNNYLVRLWLSQPFQPDTGSPDIPLQFVHEDDLADALVLLLEGRHSGAFNVAPDDGIGGRECADLIGLKRRRMPLGAVRKMAAAMWKLRQAEAPPGALEFALHPWVVSNERLRSLGWEPRHTSRETFEITMRTHGKLAQLVGSA